MRGGTDLTIIVADASALLEYLLQTRASPAVGRVLRAPQTDIRVPTLCDVEVAAGLRRGLLRGILSADRANQAVDLYLLLPIGRHGHRALLPRILDLHENFSAYDATYVALAESLGAQLLTADERLARAARTHTSLAVLPDGSRG